MQHDPARSSKLHLFTNCLSLIRLGNVPSPSTRQPPARIQIQDVRPQVDCGRYPVKVTQGDPVELAATIFKDGHDILRAVVRYRPAGSRKWLERSARADRERSLAGKLRARRARSLAVRDRGVGRPLRDDARRARPQGGGRPGRPRRRDGRGRAALRPGRPRGVARGRAGARRQGPARQGLVGHARGRRRAGAGALRRLVRALPALVGRVQGRREGACRSSPSSASTSSTCRRSTRSGRRTGRGATTRRSRRRAIPGARGRSAAPRAVTTRSIPSSARTRTSTGSSRRGASTASRSRSTSRSSARPTIPWLEQHPEWFNRRPDGTLKYAENPPKRYQDIYNVNFDSEDWRGPLGRAARRRPALVPARRSRLPRRQPAHEVGARSGSG